MTTIIEPFNNREICDTKSPELVMDIYSDCSLLRTFLNNRYTFPITLTEQARTV